MNKQILEIIELYTDKTLSEGCYFKILEGEFIEELGKPNEYGTFYIYEDDCIIHGKCITDNKNHDNSYSMGEVKILGHYSITAVHRFIAKHRPKNYTIGKYNYHIPDKDYITLDFPIKPLHLYSKTEEEKLLKLLLNLKKGTNKSNANIG